MQELENRSFYAVTDGVSFYEIETKGEKEYYIEGYISTKSVDLVGDSISDQCMEDMVIQIKNGSIKLDFEHETIKNDNLDINPIGRIIDAKKDSIGVWVKCLVNKANNRFNEIWGSIKNGMLDSFSIAFKPVRSATKYIQGKAIRLLDKVKLVNVGITGTPVNEEAKMTNVVIKALDSLSSPRELNKMAEEQVIEAVEETQSDPVVEEKAEESEEQSEEAEAESEDNSEEVTESEPSEIEAKPVEAEAESEEAENDTEVKSLIARVDKLEKENISLKAEIKSLNKTLNEPEMKAVAESSPKSIKLEKNVNPLSLI